MGVDIIPAATTACPITSAPAILTAGPTCWGSLSPASRRPSKINSIMRASITAGRGTPSRADEMLTTSGVGMTCRWKVVNATYKEGSSKEVCTKVYLIQRTKVAYINLSV
ncbi:hypothetical protein D3C81_1592250 [compost metagenome]